MSLFSKDMDKKVDWCLSSLLGSLCQKTKWERHIPTKLVFFPAQMTQMGNVKGLISLRRRKWFSWLLWMIMFLQATMGDVDDIPSTGLLCVSNCATCPLICSPPPVVTSLPLPPPPPPPEQYYSPPQSYYFPQSPPLLPPQQYYSPPQSYYLPQPPPPPSYSYYTPVAPPPPAPPSYYLNTPFAPAPPTMNGPHDYSYPYYFLYASKEFDKGERADVEGVGRGGAPKFPLSVEVLQIR
ncbi:formin-like protein 20 isoform X2 [Macadamia integrifolia]|uniref:formin-like protein 20 isoform X2 n=1 Tax=Macadamia integrifolia TaxID=60698 RepID=UPI001C500EAF|nr:formin-like protein 20 isoform X2 [Macadamia integrifolia]